MKQNGDEKTAFRFKLDKDGDVLSVNDLQKDLARREVGYVPPTSPSYSNSGEGYIDEDGDGFDDNTGEYIGDE